jgi:hypothetical protein
MELFEKLAEGHYTRVLLKSLFRMQNRKLEAGMSTQSAHKITKTHLNVKNSWYTVRRHFVEFTDSQGKLNFYILGIPRG